MTLVNGLRVFWIGLVLWYELGVFNYAVRNCNWPDFSVFPEGHSPRLPAPSHILLVADPQILDHRSYPDRSPFLTYITRLVVDLNLRNNWRAALRKKPDAVVFLGDMMDGGRFAMSEDEYEQYYRRFNAIFYLPSGIPAYFIPGNHDTGLQTFSPSAKSRYMAHFGPLNRHVSIANHTIVFLDAPGLVEEDIERQSHGQSFSHWKSVRGGPVEFVNTIAQARTTDPVVLLSHIPLARDNFDCGPLREKGTIHAGVGLGYQNTLGEEVTAFLLNRLKPVVVFSGDDHDYCESRHLSIAPEESTAIREVTVKSFSMAMGIRQPGFQLLSLFPRQYWNAAQSTASYADVPCLLPRQLDIYLYQYAPFSVLSLLIVCISNTLRVGSRQYVPRHRRRSSSLKLPSLSRSGIQDDNQMSSDEDMNSSFRLPLPASVSSKVSRTGRNLTSRVPPSSFCPSMTKALVGTMFSNQNRGLRRRKHKCFRGGIMCDVRDIAVFPLVLFMLTSLWTSFS